MRQTSARLDHAAHRRAFPPGRPSVSALNDLLETVEREEARLGLDGAGQRPTDRVLALITALKTHAGTAVGPSEPDEALRAERDALRLKLTDTRSELGRRRAEAVGRDADIQGLMSERDEVVQLLADARDGEALMRAERDEARRTKRDAERARENAERGSAEMKAALLALLRAFETGRIAGTRKRAGDRRAA